MCRNKLAIASFIMHNIEPWDFFRLILPLSRASSCSEIVRFWNRKPNILRPHPPTVGHDLHQPVRVRKRKRTQQNRTHDAENRRVRAHAQSQGKHRYDGKTRTLPKQPQAVPHVLK